MADSGNSRNQDEDDTVDATRIIVEQEESSSTGSRRPATANPAHGRTRPQPYRPYRQSPQPSTRTEPYYDQTSQSQRGAEPFYDRQGGDQFYDQTEPSPPRVERQQYYNDDSHLGAVGGTPQSYQSYVSQEQEQRVSNQARQLLEIFISDRSEHDHLPQQQRDILSHDVLQCDKRRTQQSDQSLREVSSALRIIGDQLAQEHELNRLIDLVPVDSPKETFLKVCRQMFADKQYNWGRVVALFYFAYKLLAKAVTSTLSEGIPWMRKLISWAMDFFSTYIADWIIARGGWNMISEYWGTSGRTFGALCAATIVIVLYMWRRG